MSKIVVCSERIVPLDKLTNLSWKELEFCIRQADLAIREYFEFPFIDETDPFPGNYKVRVSDIFLDKERFGLKQVDAPSSNLIRNEFDKQWMGSVLEEREARLTNHFIYIYTARKETHVDDFKYLSIKLAGHLQYDLRSSTKLYAPCEQRWDNTKSNTFGFSAYSTAVDLPLDWYNPPIKLIPTLDFFHAGNLEDSDHTSSAWKTADGTIRLQRIRRNLEIFRSMEGTHIWCCPTFLKFGEINKSATDQTNNAPMKLDLHSVYQPLIIDIQADIPSEENPSFETWLENFKLMSEIMWGPAAGILRT